MLAAGYAYTFSLNENDYFDEIDNWAGILTLTVHSQLN